MGTSKGKRVRRSASEWAQVIERFEASGLSKTAFCRREGIGEGSFGRWRARLGTPQRSDFVEWTTSAASGSLAPGEMELSLPGGVRLRLRP